MSVYTEFCVGHKRLHSYNLSFKTFSKFHSPIFCANLKLNYKIKQLYSTFKLSQDESSLCCQICVRVYSYKFCSASAQREMVQLSESISLHFKQGQHNGATGISFQPLYCLASYPPPNFHGRKNLPQFVYSDSTFKRLSL